MPWRARRSGHSRRPRPQRRRTVRHSHSAGGVAYRRRADAGIEVALIATGRGGRWQLPKGRLRPAEKPVETAVREVREETGLETVSEAFLKTVHYTYTDTYSREAPELVLKKVDFYLLRVVGGELTDTSFEVDGVAWTTPAEALRRLTFASERECLRLAQEHWNAC